jgi:hypothetical protein
VRPTLVPLLLAGLRRALYALAAFPADLACLLLVAVGQGSRAAAVRGTPLRRLLHREPANQSSGVWFLGALLSLPLDAVGFAVSGYAWLVLLLNLGYPLRPDTTRQSLHDAWGGPSLAGAWAVHAVGGVLVFLLVGLPLTSALVWSQEWMARRLFVDSGAKE